MYTMSAATGLRPRHRVPMQALREPDNIRDTVFLPQDTVESSRPTGGFAQARAGLSKFHEEKLQFFFLYFGHRALWTMTLYALNQSVASLKAPV